MTNKFLISVRLFLAFSLCSFSLFFISPLKASEKNEEQEDRLKNPKLCKAEEELSWLEKFPVFPVKDLPPFEKLREIEEKIGASGTLPEQLYRYLQKYSNRKTPDPQIYTALEGKKSALYQKQIKRGRQSRPDLVACGYIRFSHDDGGNYWIHQAKGEIRFLPTTDDKTEPFSSEAGDQWCSFNDWAKAMWKPENDS